MEDEQREVGRVRATSPGVLAGWLVAGLVGGWLLHPVAERLGDTAPLVTWAQVSVLAFVAAILAGTAWSTWRQVQVRRQWLEPHKAVNRLVLAKSCALVGALVAGGYAGYALSWLGVDAELGGQRMGRSLLAALAAALLVGASLALERACRVREDDPAG